jgi:arylsulfatase A-like enzyme
LVETLGMVYLSDRFSAEIGLALLEREPIDFVAVYLAGIDNWSHRVGIYPQVIDRYYEYVDGLLGRYVAALPPEATVFVVSDHGWDYVSGPNAEEASGHWRAPDGILLAAGPEIAPGAVLDRAPTLVDVAPTVLALYGLPASQEMSGRVLDEILTGESRARVPNRRVATYGPTFDSQSSLQLEAIRDGDAETLRKLRALGYLE